MTTIRIVAAVLDTQQLILYKEDGETITIPQGDSRIRGIIDTVTPILSVRGAVATVSLEQTNDYANFEKKTGGLIKLFRVAKKAVQHLLGSDEERQLAPTTLGQVPVQQEVKASTATAISDIMAHAVPVTSKSYRESDTTVDDTVVAMVGKGKDARLVPGVEALRDQFAHAVKLGSTKGVEALIARLGAVVENRGHSVQDVLRFLERGDLPVADDGSIIAYKILKRIPNRNNPELKAAPDLFFDCHTGKIPQKVGSYVCVDESLVDRNRRNECSNGLHIARRGYLSQFSGDVCVLTKIAPEDVVTVPHGDPNKVRVCGYHILGLIPNEEFQILRRDQAMTGSSHAQQLLGQAISGKHVAKLEEVRVTAAEGGAVVITNLVTGSVIQPNLKNAPKAVALDDKVAGTAVVDPKAVNEQVAELKAEAKTKEPNTRQKTALGLATTIREPTNALNVRKEAAESLLHLKKKSKVSWNNLGFIGDIEAEIKAVLDETPVATKLDLKAPAPVMPTTPIEKKPQTRTERANYLFNCMADGKNLHVRTNAAKELAELKKTSKLSWAALGLSRISVEDKLALLLDPPKTVLKEVITEVKAEVKPEPEQQPQKEPTKMEGNRVEVARKLYDLALNDRSQWPALWLHKRKAKYSWEALGFTKREIERINNSKPDHV